MSRVNEALAKTMSNNAQIVADLRGRLAAERDKRHMEAAKFLSEIGALKGDLLDIGNLVGGPTMTYVPAVEIQEWRKRADRISEIVSSALNTETTQAGERK